MIDTINVNYFPSIIWSDTVNVKYLDFIGCEFDLYCILTSEICVSLPTHSKITVMKMQLEPKSQPQRVTPRVNLSPILVCFFGISSMQIYLGFQFLTVIHV